jgi:hypothetical protein
MWEGVMTDYLKHCMCGCIYEQANCPNCNKTPDRELIARLRDIAVHSYLGRTFVEAAADRIEALMKNSDLQATLLGEAYDKIEVLTKERDAAWKVAHAATDRGMKAEAENARLREAAARAVKIHKEAEEFLAFRPTKKKFTTALSLAVSDLCDALQTAPTVTAGWPTEEVEGSIIVGEVKGDRHHEQRIRAAIGGNDE